jgi:hypothetical protein
VSFKVDDYVVVRGSSTGRVTHINSVPILSVWYTVESVAFDTARFCKGSSLRAASDSEILMYRLGVPHTLGKQQSIPATACSKAGSNISIRTS